LYGLKIYGVWRSSWTSPGKLVSGKEMLNLIAGFKVVVESDVVLGRVETQIRRPRPRSTASDYSRGRLSLDLMEPEGPEICPLRCGFWYFRGRRGLKQPLTELGSVYGTLGMTVEDYLDGTQILVHYLMDVDLLLLRLFNAVGRGLKEYVVLHQYHIYQMDPSFL
jgi:hypothetical protein